MRRAKTPSCCALSPTIYGLAGASVGWAFCPPAISDVLNRARLLSNVSAPSRAAAVAAPAEQGGIVALRAENARLREEFVEGVTALGLEAYESQGSLVSLRCPGGAKAAKDLYAALRARGIIARTMDTYRLPDCIRLTVGSADDRTQVIESLGEIP